MIGQACTCTRKRGLFYWFSGLLLRTYNKGTTIQKLYYLLYTPTMAIEITFPKETQFLGRPSVMTLMPRPTILVASLLTRPPGAFK